MGTIYSEQVLARAPYQQEISQCTPMPENPQWEEVGGDTAVRIGPTSDEKYKKDVQMATMMVMM